MLKGRPLYCIWTCGDEQDCVLGCFLQPVPLFLHNLFPCSVTHLQQGVSYLFIPLMISVWAVIWSRVPTSPNYLWISTQPAVNTAPVEELGRCSLSIRLVEPFFLCLFSYPNKTASYLWPLCTSSHKCFYLSLICTVYLNLILLFCHAHNHTCCLYFSFFIWNQYTLSVA